MYNYKLIVQYDGSSYAGWQIQANSITIQQTITDSIKVLLDADVNLIGSGRTDSGVHAIGQVANFRTNTKLDLYRFIYSLNSILPKDISVIKGEEVSQEFHSRFDARKRSYIYLFSKKKSPFYFNYSWLYPSLPGEAVLNDYSKPFLGTFDFTSLSRKRSDTANKICTVYNINWKETKGMMVFYIEADRFLHGMVRTIIGTILDLIKKKMQPEEITRILKEKDRQTAGEAVPAKGLFLYKVKY